jgi:type VI protein secretion system component Hcp
MLAIGVSVGVSGGLWAAETAHIKISPIRGESADKDHKDWIEVLSWSGGTSPQEPARGLATGKRQHEPLVITKRIDKATPLLAKAHAAGIVYPVIEFNVDGRHCVLTNAKIIRVKTEQATESIAFHYEKIEWRKAPADEAVAPRQPKPKRATPPAPVK